MGSEQSSPVHQQGSGERQGAPTTPAQEQALAAMLARIGSRVEDLAELLERSSGGVIKRSVALRIAHAACIPPQHGGSVKLSGLITLLSHACLVSSDARVGFWLSVFASKEELAGGQITCQAIEELVSTSLALALRSGSKSVANVRALASPSDTRIQLCAISVIQWFQKSAPAAAAQGGVALEDALLNFIEAKGFRLNFGCEAWLYDVLLGNNQHVTPVAVDLQASTSLEPEPEQGRLTAGADSDFAFLRAWLSPELEVDEERSSLLCKYGRLMVMLAVAPLISNKKTITAGHAPKRCLTVSAVLAAGPALPWVRLYDSSTVGTALHTLVRAIEGYAGPTIFVMRLRLRSRGGNCAAGPVGLVGAYLDTPWKSGETWCGGRDSFLWSIAENGGTRWFRTKSTSTNPLHCAYMSHMPGRANAASKGLGFGGQKRGECRLQLDADLTRGTAHNSASACTTYEAGDLLWCLRSGALQTGLDEEFDILAMQVWGTGNADAIAQRNALKQHRDATAAKTRKVDRMAFIDTETGRLDSATAKMLSGGEWGAKNAADISRSELTSASKR